MNKGWNCSNCMSNDLASRKLMNHSTLLGYMPIDRSMGLSASFVLLSVYFLSLLQAFSSRQNGIRLWSTSSDEHRCFTVWLPWELPRCFDDSLLLVLLKLQLPILPMQGSHLRAGILVLLLAYWVIILKFDLYSHLNQLYRTLQTEPNWTESQVLYLAESNKDMKLTVILWPVKHSHSSSFVL